MGKDDVILPGVMEAALKEAVGRELPLKFDGFEIGTALILSEGHIVAKLNDTDVSEEVKKRIFGDRTMHLSISPRNTP